MSVSRQKAQGTFATLRSIAAEGGFRGLYVGLPATLIIGVPSNVLYFATYETLRDLLQALSGGLAYSAPIVAGATGRAVAVVAVAPLELVRTRLQAGSEHVRSGGSLVGHLRNIVRQEGASVLFRGLQSTLWRDVPFSAAYWVGVEAIRSQLIQHGWWEGWSMQKPVASLIASCVAGGASALCTAPFDVVKTRRQVATTAPANPVNTADTPGSMWRTIANMSREEGISSLWAGFVPRMGRVVPACSIMLCSYETTKMILKLK